MGEIVHNKLVRDKVSFILITKGHRVNTYIISDNKEYGEVLLNKLIQEIGEYAEVNDMEKLIDIIEVIYTIAVEQGVDRLTLEKMRVDKLRSEGGFRHRVLLKEVID